jgi:Circularly permuted ATP-grasp type 2
MIKPRASGHAIAGHGALANTLTGVPPTLLLDNEFAVVNQVTTEYVDECFGKGSSLRRAPAEVVLPHTYSESYGKLMLTRPLFVDHDEITGFADDLTALFTLLTSLPARCFDGNLQRYCAALGMDERLAELMRLGATGHPELYGRADAYHDGTSFKLLEFNVGSELGGIDAVQMNRAFLNVASFRDFADRHQLAYIDTAAVLADELRTAARRVTSSGEPVVALLEGPGGLNEHMHVFVAIQEAMRGHGIDLVLGEIDQVRFRDGKVMLDSIPVDVVLRYFAADQLLDHPTSRDTLDLLMRVHRTGGTVLFTSLESGLFASKTCLALVHDPRLREEFTEAERELVDRIVPWTRAVGAGSDNRGELLDACRHYRDALILKPGVGYGGVGAVLGREVSDRDWSDILAAVEDQDYVVQRIVTPATEPVCNPDTGALEDWRANWGVFTTRAGYAGAFVRALQVQDGSVISYSNAGTRGACVYTYPRNTK